MPVRPYDQNQTFLLPPSLNEWVRADHPVRVFSEMVDRLDAGRLHETKAEGRPHYDRRMLLKVLLWAYANGIRASRKIAERLHSDIAYMWLAGLEKPDFRTVCGFRRANLTVLEELFVQVLAIARDLGMLRLGLVALDGTKVRANAGVESFRRAEDWQQELRQARKEVRRILREAEAADQADDRAYGPEQAGDELPEDIKDARARIEKLEKLVKRIKATGQAGLKVSRTDPEARWMHGPVGSLPAYNAQVAVTGDHLIVYSAVTSEPIDTNQVGPALAGIERNTGAPPERLAADAGYKSGANLVELERRGIDGYLPDCEEKNIGQDVRRYPELYGKEAFAYDAVRDCYTCPAGATLWPAARKTSLTKYSSTSGWIYKTRRGTCPNCPQQQRCTVNRHPVGRSLTRDAYDDARRRMKEKLRTAEGRAIYGLRKCLVEPVIGQLKTIGGLGRFLLRGLSGARTEWQWATLAYNLRKIVRWQRSGAALATGTS
jgi:transposase